MSAVRDCAQAIIVGIAEQMISLPKSISTIYESLPEAKREAIDKRDAS
jgi:hypothetical protein